MTAKRVAITLPQQKIEKLCKKWKIKELALFGSVLREDFDVERSDLDVLITFLPDVVWGRRLRQLRATTAARMGWGWSGFFLRIFSSSECWIGALGWTTYFFSCAAVIHMRGEKLYLELIAEPFLSW